MHIMRQNTYTCVPIMEGNRVVGVFDENSLFEYISEEEIVEIAPSLTFADIKAHLSLASREMEEFLFFGSQRSVDDLQIEFEKCFRKGKRLAVVFLTPSGKESEEVVGIITAWDILGM